MPFKFDSKGRRHIPRQRHRVTNWRDCDTALRNRGSLTIWFTDEALAGWKAQPRTTPGGQPHYSDLAIETGLTLRAVFRLALRQSEGLIGSIMRMLEIDLPVPDHTTLSRRACGLPVPEPARTGTDDLQLIVDSTGLELRGAGEGLFEKHGTAKRRAWRKLHIGLDANSGEIVAFDLTDKDVDDASHVEHLLGQLVEAPRSFMADGAYDRSGVLDAVLASPTFSTGAGWRRSLGLGGRPARLPNSRQGTCWSHILETLVCYRLIDPGSEWRLHRLWFEQSAMGDLLGEDLALVEKNALYRDKFVEHKPALFTHLRRRWQDLFGAHVLLYDLTSTYFGSNPPDDESDKRRYGYSRDKRPDCVQVVIALVVTPDGFPLAYDVLPGATSDKTTLCGFLSKIEA